ncbi:hypothetical protein AB0A77_34130 [Streptomyces varsoviensis]|uniref:hypothetical protein n=1 Tax=Streptomyces varsoviensis TaxID=67373 RepID=UPI0033F28A2D
MTTEDTRRRAPRAAIAVRTVRIARELHHLVPEAAVVRFTPVWTDRTGTPRLAQVVTLLDSYGRPVDAGLAAHRYARDLVRRNFSRADWTRQHRYDVRTGHLAQLGAPQLPPAFGGAL